jgi:hypothetical protein
MEALIAAVRAPKVKQRFDATRFDEVQVPVR